MSGIGILGSIVLLLFGWLGVGAPVGEPVSVEPQAGEGVPEELEDLDACISMHGQDFEQCKHVAPNGPTADANGDPVDVIIN